MTAGEPNATPADFPMAEPVLPIARPADSGPVFVNQAVSIHGIVQTILGWVVFIACFSVVIMLALFFLGGSQVGSASHWGIIIGAALVASLIQGIIPSIQRIRMRRRVRAIIPEHPFMPLDQLVATIHGQRCWFSRYAGTKEMVKLLAEHERRNEAARFCHQSQMHSVSPLHVEFEPRLLDETDAGFRELADSTTPGAAGDQRLAGKDNLVLRKLWRNMNLKSGKLSLILFLVFWGMAMLDTISTGKISFKLMFWTIIVAMSLFSPATGGVFSNKWHIVPAGLFVLLGTNPDKLKWYAFDRRESILAVHQLTRHKWIILVCDGMMSMECYATTEEVHMLLRAWLSPLPMPEEERLAALASA